MKRRKGFNMLYPDIWRSKRFQALDSDGKLLLFYFMTCQHQNAAGTFRIPDGYVIADLKWSIDAYHAALAQLTEAKLVAYDTETTELYVSGWFRFCPPTNDNHASGIMNRIGDLDSDNVREVMEAEFTAANKARLVNRFRSEQEAAE